MTAPSRSHGRSNDAWARLCLSKVRFADEYCARARAGQLVDGEATARRLWVYRCPNCRGWHMTSSFTLNRTSSPVIPGDLYKPPPVPPQPSNDR